MREAIVYYKDIPAGILTEVEEDAAYRFRYLPELETMVADSFLTDQRKAAYIALLRERMSKLAN